MSSTGIETSSFSSFVDPKTSLICWVTLMNVVRLDSSFNLLKKDNNSIIEIEVKIRYEMEAGIAWMDMMLCSDSKSTVRALFDE